MNDFGRRDVLRLIGAAAVAGPMAMGQRGFAQDRAKELNILCWEGYNSAQVLDPFRTEKGATVKAESLTNDPTMINRLRAGETNVWDLINVNNPWAREIMLPEGLIKPLDRASFEPFFETMLPAFKPPYKWAMSADGSELIGMAQRFGPYSFVVNTDKVSRATAEDQGWDSLERSGQCREVRDPRIGRLERLQRLPDRWDRSLPGAYARGDAEVRGDGEDGLRRGKGGRRHRDDEPGAGLGRDRLPAHRRHLFGFAGAGGRAAEPARDHAPEERHRGKGGVSWIEITSTVNNPNLSPLATEFLKFVQAPEVAHTVAFAEGTFNPVAQMGNPACFDLFSADELDAIQWDSLEEEMDRSAEYNIVPDYDAALDLMTAAKRARG